MIIYDFKKISRSRRKYLYRCRRKVLKKMDRLFLPEFRRVELQEQADELTGILRAGYEPVFWAYDMLNTPRSGATMLAFMSDGFSSEFAR